MFGGFPGNNFWSPEPTSSESIQRLLENKDCTVEQLLNDNDCVQEIKSQNDKLIEFFDHEKLKILIKYITVMPTEADGHDRGRKYPFVSGEILGCENHVRILEKLFEGVDGVGKVGPNVEDKGDGHLNDDKIGQKDAILNTEKEQETTLDKVKTQDKQTKQTDTNILNFDDIPFNKDADDPITKPGETGQQTNANQYILLDQLFNFIKTADDNE